jgi:hypothetical protein
MALVSISDALIEAYRTRKAEYESFGKTDHPEYKKICAFIEEIAAKAKKEQGK